MMWHYTEMLAWLATDRGSYAIAIGLATLTLLGIKGRLAAVLVILLYSALLLA